MEIIKGVENNNGRETERFPGRKQRTEDGMP